jgi:hypothetical protein
MCIQPNVNTIIIDEISMMTSNMLCVMQQCLKQTMHIIGNMFPFDTTLVILIADLAQLPTRWHKTHIIK